jgi:hypothetical protein
LQEEQYLQLQEQLFATEPSQLPGLICLAMDAPTAELVIAAATGADIDMPAAWTAARTIMATGISRFPQEARQALQQQLAGEQLVMLLQAAISRDHHDALWMLLNQPAAAQLPADIVVQLLQQALFNSGEYPNHECAAVLALSAAAAAVAPATAAALLEQALHIDWQGEDHICNVRFDALIKLPAANKLDAAAVARLLAAAIEAEQPEAAGCLCSLPAASEMQPSTVQQLLQQAVDHSTPAGTSAPEDGGYPKRALCAKLISNLTSAQRLSLTTLKAWMQQALQKQDGAMLAALLSGMQGVAAGLSSREVLQYLQAAVQLEYLADAAVEQLCYLAKTVSSNASANEGSWQVEEAESLLSTAIQRGRSFEPLDLYFLDEHAVYWPLAADSLVLLPVMQQLSGEAVARLLTAAVEFENAVVGQELCKLPAAVEVPRELLSKLLDAAVAHGWVEPACSMRSLLQKLLQQLLH